jgi:hypothetical protein
VARLPAHGLWDLGVDITPLIASAGIAGTRSGSTQTLVRDTISGCSSSWRGSSTSGTSSYDRGGTVSGTVESTSAPPGSGSRTGRSSTVPNGLIEVTNNRTRGWGRGCRRARRAGRGSRSRPRGAGGVVRRDPNQPPLGEWLGNRRRCRGDADHRHRG